MEVWEAGIPRLEQCTLNSFCHPWSVGLDLITQSIEVETSLFHVDDHPIAKLVAAVTSILFKHPHQEVIIDAFGNWLTIKPTPQYVLEPKFLYSLLKIAVDLYNVITTAVNSTADSHRDVTKDVSFNIDNG